MRDRHFAAGAAAFSRGRIGFHIVTCSGVLISACSILIAFACLLSTDQVVLVVTNSCRMPCQRRSIPVLQARLKAGRSSHCAWAVHCCPKRYNLSAFCPQNELDPSACVNVLAWWLWGRVRRATAPALLPGAWCVMTPAHASMGPPHAPSPQHRAPHPPQVARYLTPGTLATAAKHGVALVQIDPHQPLDAQGPFNGIIHKLPPDPSRRPAATAAAAAIAALPARPHCRSCVDRQRDGCTADTSARVLRSATSRGRP